MFPSVAWNVFLTGKLFRIIVIYNIDVNGLIYGPNKLNIG